MECQKITEYIDLYLDGMLDEDEKNQFLRHIDSCAACRKEYEDFLKIKDALGSLEEKQPPERLAKTAIRKAKRRVFPVAAYASAAVAAAVALVIILSSQAMQGTVVAEQVAEKQMTFTEVYDANVFDSEEGVAGAAFGESAEQSFAESEYAAMPESENAVNESADDSDLYESDMLDSQRNGIYPITVPGEIAESFEQILDDFIVNNDLIAGYENKIDSRIVSFTVTEECFEQFLTMLDEAGIVFNSNLVPLSLVEFTFEK